MDFSHGTEFFVIVEKGVYARSIGHSAGLNAPNPQGLKLSHHLQVVKVYYVALTGLVAICGHGILIVSIPLGDY